MDLCKIQDLVRLFTEGTSTNSLEQANKNFIVEALKDLRYNAARPEFPLGILEDLTLSIRELTRHNKPGIHHLLDVGLLDIFESVFEVVKELTECGPLEYLQSLLECIVETVNNVAEINPTVKSLAVLQLCKYFLGFLEEERLCFQTRMELLKSSNILLEQCASETKAALMKDREIREQIFLLVDTVFIVGDYEFQVGILECLLRLFPRKHRKKYAAFFIQDCQVLEGFLNIRDQEFETDCRGFLNMCNSNIGLHRSVFSFPCKRTYLGTKQLKKPADPGYEEFWVDFNAGSQRITLFCEHDFNFTQDSQLEEDMWETVTIYKKDVETCSYTEVADTAILEIKLKDSICELYPSQPDVEEDVVRIEFQGEHACDVENAVGKTFQFAKNEKILKVSTVSTPVHINIRNNEVPRGEVINNNGPNDDVSVCSQSSVSRRKISVPLVPMRTPASTSLPTSILRPEEANVKLTQNKPAASKPSNPKASEPMEPVLITPVRTEKVLCRKETQPEEDQNIVIQETQMGPEKKATDFDFKENLKGSKKAKRLDKDASKVPKTPPVRKHCSQSKGKVKTPVVIVNPLSEKKRRDKADKKKNKKEDTSKKDEVKQTDVEVSSVSNIGHLEVDGGVMNKGSGEHRKESNCDDQVDSSRNIHGEDTVQDSLPVMQSKDKKKRSSLEDSGIGLNDTTLVNTSAVVADEDSLLVKKSTATEPAVIAKLDETKKNKGKKNSKLTQKKRQSETQSSQNPYKNLLMLENPNDEVIPDSCIATEDLSDLEDFKQSNVCTQPKISTKNGKREKNKQNCIGRSNSFPEKSQVEVVIGPEGEMTRKENDANIDDYNFSGLAENKENIYLVQKPRIKGPKSQKNAQKMKVKLGKFPTVSDDLIFDDDTDDGNDDENKDNVAVIQKKKEGQKDRRKAAKFKVPFVTGENVDKSEIRSTNVIDAGSKGFSEDEELLVCLKKKAKDKDEQSFEQDQTGGNESEMTCDRNKAKKRGSKAKNNNKILQQSGYESNANNTEEDTSRASYKATKKTKIMETESKNEGIKGGEGKRKKENQKVESVYSDSSEELKVECDVTKVEKHKVQQARKLKRQEKKQFVEDVSVSNDDMSIEGENGDTALKAHNRRTRSSENQGKDVQNTGSVSVDYKEESHAEYLEEEENTKSRGSKRGRKPMTSHKDVKTNKVRTKELVIQEEPRSGTSGISKKLEKKKKEDDTAEVDNVSCDDKEIDKAGHKKSRRNKKTVHEQMEENENGVIVEEKPESKGKSKEKKQKQTNASIVHTINNLQRDEDNAFKEEEKSRSETNGKQKKAIENDVVVEAMSDDAVMEETPRSKSLGRSKKNDKKEPSKDFCKSSAESITTRSVDEELENKSEFEKFKKPDRKLKKTVTNGEMEVVNNRQECVASEKQQRYRSSSRSKKKQPEGTVENVYGRDVEDNVIEEHLENKGSTRSRKGSGIHKRADQSVKEMEVDMTKHLVKERNESSRNSSRKKKKQIAYREELEINDVGSDSSMTEEDKSAKLGKCRKHNTTVGKERGLEEESSDFSVEKKPRPGQSHKSCQREKNSCRDIAKPRDGAEMDFGETADLKEEKESHTRRKTFGTKRKQTIHEKYADSSPSNEDLSVNEVNLDGIIGAVEAKFSRTSRSKERNKKENLDQHREEKIAREVEPMQDHKRRQQSYRNKCFQEKELNLDISNSKQLTCDQIMDEISKSNVKGTDNSCKKDDSVSSDVGSDESDQEDMENKSSSKELKRKNANPDLETHDCFGFSSDGEKSCSDEPAVIDESSKVKNRKGKKTVKDDQKGTEKPAVSQHASERVKVQEESLCNSDFSFESSCSEDLEKCEEIKKKGPKKVKQAKSNRRQRENQVDVCSSDLSPDQTVTDSLDHIEVCKERTKREEIKVKTVSESSLFANSCTHEELGTVARNKEDKDLRPGKNQNRKRTDKKQKDPIVLEAKKHRNNCLVKHAASESNREKSMLQESSVDIPCVEFSTNDDGVIDEQMLRKNTGNGKISNKANEKPSQCIAEPKSCFGFGSDEDQEINELSTDEEIRNIASQLSQSSAEKSKKEVVPLQGRASKRPKLDVTQSEKYEVKQERNGEKFQRVCKEVKVSGKKAGEKFGNVTVHMEERKHTPRKKEYRNVSFQVQERCSKSGRVEPEYEDDSQSQESVTDMSQSVTATQKKVMFYMSYTASNTKRRQKLLEKKDKWLSKKIFPDDPYDFDAECERASIKSEPDVTIETENKRHKEEKNEKQDPVKKNKNETLETVKTNCGKSSKRRQGDNTVIIDSHSKNKMKEPDIVIINSDCEEGNEVSLCQSHSNTYSDYSSGDVVSNTPCLVHDKTTNKWKRKAIKPETLETKCQESNGERKNNAVVKQKCAEDKDVEVKKKTKGPRTPYFDDLPDMIVEERGCKEYGNKVMLNGGHGQTKSDLEHQHTDDEIEENMQYEDSSASGNCIVANFSRMLKDIVKLTIPTFQDIVTAQRDEITEAATREDTSEAREGQDRKGKSNKVKKEKIEQKTNLVVVKKDVQPKSKSKLSTQANLQETSMSATSTPKMDCNLLKKKYGCLNISLIKTPQSVKSAGSGFTCKQYKMCDFPVGSIDYQPEICEEFDQVDLRSAIKTRPNRNDVTYKDLSDSEIDLTDESYMMSSKSFNKSLNSTALLDSDKKGDISTASNEKSWILERKKGRPAKQKPNKSYMSDGGRCLQLYSNQLTEREANREKVTTWNWSNKSPAISYNHLSMPSAMFGSSTNNQRMKKITFGPATPITPAFDKEEEDDIEVMPSQEEQVLAVQMANISKAWKYGSVSGDLSCSAPSTHGSDNETNVDADEIQKISMSGFSLKTPVKFIQEEEERHHLENNKPVFNPRACIEKLRGLVSGPSSTVRPSRSSLKRKFPEVEEEEDVASPSCSTEDDLDVLESSKLQPKKLFRCDSPAIVRAIELQSDRSCSDDALTDGLLDDEQHMEVTFEAGVSTFIKAFGADVQNQMMVKKQKLDAVTKNTLKTIQRDFNSSWYKQKQHRAQVLSDYQDKVFSELVALDKDINRMKESEEKLTEFYTYQVKELETNYKVQKQRLENLKTLQSSFNAAMKNTEKQCTRKHQSTQETLRQEMKGLQKRLLQETQQQEMANVKRCLQSLF